VRVSLAEEIVVVSAASADALVVLVDGLHHRRVLQEVVMVEAVQAVRQLIEVLRDVMMGGGRGGHQGRRRRRRMRPSLMVVVGAQQRVVVVVGPVLLPVLLRLRHRVRPSRRVEDVADHETRSRSCHERHGGQHGRRVLVGHSQHFSGGVLVMTLDAGPAGRTSPRRSGRQSRRFQRSSSLLLLLLLLLFSLGARFGRFRQPESLAIVVVVVVVVVVVMMIAGRLVRNGFPFGAAQRQIGGRRRRRPDH